MDTLNKTTPNETSGNRRVSPEANIGKKVDAKSLKCQKEGEGAMGSNPSLSSNFSTYKNNDLAFSHPQKHCPGNYRVTPTALGGPADTEQTPFHREECLTVEMPVVAHEAPPVGCFVDVLLPSGKKVEGRHVFCRDNGTLWAAGVPSFILEVPGQEGLPWQYSKCGNCGARAPFCTDCEVDQTETLAEVPEYPSAVAGMAAWCTETANPQCVALASKLQDDIHAWWDRFAPPSEELVAAWEDFEVIAEAMFEVLAEGPFMHAARRLLRRNLRAFGRVGDAHYALAKLALDFMRAAPL